MKRTEAEIRAAYLAAPDAAALDRLNTVIDTLAEPQAHKPLHQRRSMRLAPLLAGLAVVVVGIGGGTLLHRQHNDASGGSTISGSESAALRLWAGFPVDASPRPVVLTGAAINDPATGFTNAAEKIAYLSGDFDLGTALPSAPRASGGQPIMSASDALAILRGQGAGAPAPTTALRITDVHLGNSTFSTDRGPRSLPAWIFTLAGVTDPAGVLAIPPAHRWPQSGQPHHPARFTVTFSSDRHRATISFVGGPSGNGPCGAEYSIHLAQSSTAVEVSIQQLPSPNTSSATACTTIALSRSLTVTLNPALGNRVMVDSSGTPLPSS